MTRLNASDLPPEVRRKLGIEGGGHSKPKPSRKDTGLSDSGPGRCGTCGDRFETALAWEKHAEAKNCTRWDIDLEASK